MSDPAPRPIPLEITVLELLFLTLRVAVETLGPEFETHGIVDQAQDLQEVITSYWRSVYDNIEEDELPF